MKSVLLVDDDAVFRNLCKRVFEEEGYRVVLAEDGATAIDAVKAESLDVAILDVRMPQKTGLDVAEEIRAVKPLLPIILCTGCDDLCAIDSRSRYAAACVGKSSSFTELVLAVSRVLSPTFRTEAFRYGLPQNPELA